MLCAGIIGVIVRFRIGVLIRVNSYMPIHTNTILGLVYAGIYWV